MKDLFVDQLLGISVLQGIARLDFARIDDIYEEKGKMKMSGSYRVAMPLTLLNEIAEKGTEAVKYVRENKKATSEKQKAKVNVK